MNRMMPQSRSRAMGCRSAARPGYPICPPPVSISEPCPELQPLSLAMAYVPIQRWGEIYPSCRALSRGTLFPPLDLPFGEGGVG